jgi:hypothetical protein
MEVADSDGKEIIFYEAQILEHKHIAPKDK